jgi:hypothetical protein
MGFSAKTYRVVLKTTGTSGRLRRCWEICECNINGGGLRVIARTPDVLGEGDAQDEKLAASRNEAKTMAAAFSPTRTT